MAVIETENVDRLDLCKDCKSKVLGK